MKSFVLALAFLGPLQSLDDAVQDAVQSHRRPMLEGPMAAATGIGKPAIVLGGLLVISFFTGSAGPLTARTALVALIPTNLAVEGTKRLTQRERPDGSRKRSNSAFPSSHAANAFALAAVFARRWRRLAIPWFALASVVAFSRMYLDRHWLSDVVVGALVGVLGAALAQAWFARARRDSGSQGT